MARKDGIEVNVRPLICVKIVGRMNDRKGGALIRREDDYLVREFTQWQIDNQVYADLETGGMSGGGRYLGFFDPKDIDKIKAFFRKKRFRIK